MGSQKTGPLLQKKVCQPGEEGEGRRGLSGVSLREMDRVKKTFCHGTRGLVHASGKVWGEKMLMDLHKTVPGGSFKRAKRGVGRPIGWQGKKNSSLSGTNEGDWSCAASQRKRKGEHTSESALNRNGSDPPAKGESGNGSQKPGTKKGPMLKRCWEKVIFKVGGKKKKGFIARSTEKAQNHHKGKGEGGQETRGEMPL